MSIYSQIPTLKVVTEEVIENQNDVTNQTVTNDEPVTLNQEDEKSYQNILKSYEKPIALSKKDKGKSSISLNKENLQEFISFISETEFEGNFLNQKDLISILSQKIHKDSGVLVPLSKSKEIFNKIGFSFRNRKRNSVSISID